MTIKKIIFIPIFLGLFSGCANYATLKNNDTEITLVESKLTHKSVNILTEVEAIKVTTGAQPDSAIPSVSLGWFWTFWGECLPNETLTFYKESYSAFSNAIVGKTFLRIENNSKDKIIVKSTPKYFFDAGILKLGFGENITKIRHEKEKNK